MDGCFIDYIHWKDFLVGKSISSGIFECNFEEAGLLADWNPIYQVIREIFVIEEHESKEATEASTLFLKFLKVRPELDKVSYEKNIWKTEERDV